MLVAYSVAGDSTANVRLYPLAKMASSAPELSTMTCLFFSTTAAAAEVAPDPYGPRMSLRPLSLNWSMSWAGTSDFDVSSWYWISSFIFWLPTGTPPLALTTLTQTS